MIRHPFEANKRANVLPHTVQELLEVVWDGPKGFCAPIATPAESRAHAAAQIQNVRSGVVNYQVITTISLEATMFSLIPLAGLRLIVH